MPEELVKGSGIFILSVNVETVINLQNEQVVEEVYRNSKKKFMK
ncbi:hypothetical protein J2S17_005767 [Cytobacillus purgationiresistens]|uniref:Uncharacterized protein n=1 Tax=Cytobacillus purgationiresistens TaxID=863449 RepID=A0ABU0ARJ9_9BACI|nr:hypothetical protein [Cytobacillus purgationiresistens]